MGKMRQSAYVLVSVVAFVVLAVVASVEFSGNQEKANNIKEGGLYKTVGVVIKKAETFLASPAAVNVGATLNSDQELISKEKRTEFLDKLKEYIQIEKNEDGYQITLQNSDGIIFQKTFSI